MKFVRRKGGENGNALLNVVASPTTEVPIPGRAGLETLHKKAESIVNKFKRFCNTLGGSLSGNPYDIRGGLSCILPTKASVKVNAMKRPIYGPKDKIERWYVDIEMSATLEDGRKAWFHESSHTARMQGVGINVGLIDSQHTEYFSPAFEWTKVEANGVSEIALRTHPVNNDINLIIVGKRRF